MQGRSDAIGYRLQFGMTVVHGHAESDALQHLHVIEAVAKGNRLVRLRDVRRTPVDAIRRPRVTF